MRGQVGIDVALSAVGIFIAFALVGSLADRIVEDVGTSISTVLCYIASDYAKALGDLNVGHFSASAGVFAVQGSPSETNVVWEGKVIRCG